LTCWELIEAGVKVTMICDTAVGRVIQEGMVDLCIVGADRIASNGDVANKIGTYQIAIVARECGIPLYVAAPLSTFDSHIEDGREIPIEVRGEDEVRGVFGREVFPSGVDIYNPAFDITPGDLVSAFITEKGIIYPPYDKNLRGLDEEEAV
jgi:methylthioribose-1-phosphate isomerase